MNFIIKMDKNIETYTDDYNESISYTIFNDTSSLFYSFIKNEDYTLEHHLISYIYYPPSCYDTQLYIKKSGGKVILGFKGLGLDGQTDLKEIVEKGGQEFPVVIISDNKINIIFDEFYEEVYIRLDENNLQSHLKEVLD